MSVNSKPSVTLKDADGFVNYLEWKRSWETHLPGYGTAGREILDNRDIRSLEWKPVIGPTLREQQIIGGVLQMVERPMTAEDRKQIPTKYAAWETAEEKYCKAKGQLFANILSTIEPNLYAYIENQPDFEQILTTTNVRALWTLIRRVISNRGGSQGDLYMKWKSLEQGSKTLTEHINQLEKLYANIDLTVYPITARQRAEQLVKSVDLKFFSPIIGRYILMIEQPTPVGVPDPFPGYNVVKDELIRYNEVMNKLDNKNEGESSTILLAKDDGGVCYNCLKSGHFQNGCRNPPKCIVCGQAHRSDQHEKYTNKDRNSNIVRRYESKYPDHKEKSKQFKLVRMAPKSFVQSSSSSITRPSNGVVSGGKKLHKKPFQLKVVDNKIKEPKKIYYLQEIEDDEGYIEASDDMMEDFVVDDEDGIFEDDE